MTRRIMIVDDDSVLRMTLQEILIDEGQDVITAEDGYQAVELASEGQFALIFMDVQMPGMNGVDALKKIKEILPECVVVMMTGFSVDALVRRAMSEGALTILIKPIVIERMIEILDQVFSETTSA